MTRSLAKTKEGSPSSDVTSAAHRPSREERAWGALDDSPYGETRPAKVSNEPIEGRGAHFDTLLSSLNRSPRVLAQRRAIDSWHTPRETAFSPPAVVQFTKEKPAKIVVFVDKKSGTILRVETPEGSELPFILAAASQSDSNPEVQEGTVVFSTGSATQGVRFATDSTKLDQLGVMKKFLPKEIEVREAEGGSKEEEEAPEEATAETFHVFKASVKTGEGKRLIDERFSGFESGKGSEDANQADVHFEKHGEEFEAEDKSAYIKLAKSFGEQDGPQFMEAILGNTLIKVDPPGMKIRRVFVANGKKIRTFYVWDPDFSSDPFAYAIFYTITHNMKRGLREIDPGIIELFQKSGVDLFAMEIEVATKRLYEGLMISEVAEEVKCPENLIRRILSTDWKLEMHRGIQRGMKKESLLKEKSLL